MGHYCYDLYRRVATDHAMITNFRHPATRVLSLYNYFRHAVPDTPQTRRDEIYFAVRLAKAVDFPEFVMSDDDRVTTYIEDHHFRQLAGCGWFLSVQRDFDDVCDLIDRMAWFYVCEYPLLSVRWGRSVLGTREFDIRAANVTPEGPHVTASVLGISDRAFDRILDLNQRDLPIYSHGVARFFSEIRDLSRSCDGRWRATKADESGSDMRHSGAG